MLQSVWTDQGIVLEDVAPPPLKPDWVRLKIHACGICGSDLHGYKDGKIRAGGRPGHEMSGTIMESTVDLPDVLYAVEPWLWCGECEFCRIGKVQLCRKGGLVGVSVPGGLADFIDVPAMHVYPCDPSLTPVEASLTEPFGICTRAVHLADLNMDTRVLILGAGSLGLISGMLSRGTAERVAISYRYASQAEAAKKLGLEAVPEDEVVAWAQDYGPDVVIETVGGHANTMEQATAACRPDGRIVVLGLFSEPGQLDMRALIHKELKIMGSAFFGTSEHGPEFRASTKILPHFKSELNVLQTHQFPLSRVAAAFEAAVSKDDRPIKVTILPGA
ncbi:MAG TPA: alcohol dehydrogenase catalytic domain-containing protein [Dehalococcoidia bacterium]|jgi:threonine dehydrogenase-like Zn-dependent dehydrogenase